jgi:hypothetical protein
MDFPEGFKPIAVRDDRLGTTVISYNPDTKEYILVVGEHSMGPLKKIDLKCLLENVKDVIDHEGHFIYIEEYGVDGSRRGEIL